MKAPVILGLTGGIGSGKSFVAEVWRELGVKVIDADVLAREVLMQKEVVEALVLAFGQQICETDGRINRDALRAYAFASQSRREQLNQIMHPMIAQSLQQALSQTRMPEETASYRVLMIPLLFENAWHKHCAAVVVVDVDEDTQYARALARGKQTGVEIKQIMAAQLGRMARLQQANFLIDNHGSMQETREQAVSLHYQFEAYFV